MPETATHLIANKKDTALKPVLMLAQVHYVFTPKNVLPRPGINEIAHCRPDYCSRFALLLPRTLLRARLVANAPEVN